MQIVKEIKGSGFAPSGIGNSTFHSGYALGLRVMPSGVFGSIEVRDCFGSEYLYQELLVNGVLTDVNDLVHLSDHRQFIMQAHGSLLVGGTGLGGFLYRILRKPNVDFVTVAEPNIDLMNLLSNGFSDYSSKLSFVNCCQSDIVNTHVYDMIYFADKWNVSG
jgi:hypothetical protein